MTTLLEKAIARAQELPDAEQDALAQLMLERLEDRSDVAEAQQVLARIEAGEETLPWEAVRGSGSEE